MKQLRYLMFTLTIITVLALSAMTTVPALADDSTPPPPTEEPVVVNPPAVDSAVTEDAPVVEPSPTESAPAIDPAPAEVVATEVPVVEEQTPTDDEDITNVLASVPEGTAVVVTNADGENLPLASAEAAQAIDIVDPMWCPTGVKPGGAGCTIPYPSLQNLIDEIKNGNISEPSANGVIWIEGTGDASSASIVLDGSPGSLILGHFNTWGNFSLTLQGGWGGCSPTCVSTIDPSSPAVFDQAISIINWNGNVTLTDIVISGVTTGTALNIQTSKSVILTNVQVTSNTGAAGVHIDNNNLSAVGNVSITNSTFSGNSAGAGLQVVSDGNITLKDVTAEDNGGSGISLNNTAAGITGGIGLSGVTVVSNNTGDGIYAISNGTITASNIVANGNIALGANFNNSGSGIAAKAITIMGNSNQFKFNGNGGLKIVSAGAVTLNSITATNNTGSNQGVSVNNTSSTKNSLVTLLGTNTFNNNVGGGLAILSKGIITTNNLTVKENGADGVSLQNDTVSASTPKAVNILGTNFITANAGDGLYVHSQGVITIRNFTSTSNTTGGMGASLNNQNAALPQNVIFVGTTTVSDNAAEGLSIATNGSVLLGNITANNNVNYGVYIDNSTGSTRVNPVTLSAKVNNFNDNSGYGLWIESLGVITVNNVQANYNADGGAYLDNSLGAKSAGINITGVSSFSNNGGTGLEVQTKGKVILKDFDATSNDGSGAYGVYIDNSQSGQGGGDVIIGTTRLNWSNDVSGNYLSGLEIVASGAVTLFNITAENNGDNSAITPYGYGVYIDNSLGATKPVTLNGTNSFVGNYNGGLYILTKGAVILNNLYADGNGDDGVYVDNRTLPATPQNVSILGYGAYSNNGLSGLSVQSYGTVLLTKTYADTNGMYGIFVDNFNGDAILVRGVTANGGIEAYNSGLDGVNIHSLGAILLNNLNASDNTGGDGANLNNDEIGAVGGITITGAIANGNVSGSGIYAVTLSNILISNLSVSDNGDYGAFLSNTGINAVGIGAITLSGTYNKAYDNQGSSGLALYSNHAIMAANIDAANNAYTGMIVDNTALSASLPQNVVITGTNYFNSNGDDGLMVSTYGNITTSNLNAEDNGVNAALVNPGTGYGVYLDNCLPSLGVCTAVTPRGVVLTGLNIFSGNYQQGLHVESLGAISAANLTANGNSGTDSPATAGVYLTNRYNESATSSGIVLTGVNTFDNNLKNGLSIYSFGLVTLSNLNANSNGDGSATASDNGAYIDVYNSYKASRVTITGTNIFNGNEGNGLKVKSNSSITISNLTANFNDGNGARLDNFSGGYLTSSAITLTGTNVFNGNGMNGLDFETYGAATFSNITADNNDPLNVLNGSGVVGTSHAGAISITCGSMTNNGLYGWSLNAHTTITLKGVFATINDTANENIVGGTLVKTNSCP